MEPFSGLIKALEPWSLVRVKWRDAYAPHSGWHEVEDYEPEEAVAITVGRVWHDCQEHYLTVVGTIFEPEDGTVKTVGDINHIPLAWLIEVVELKENTDGNYTVA